MFVWTFSDLHSGMPSCYDNFHTFLDDVERQRPDLLLGIGDIFELVWYSFDHARAFRPTRQAIEHLKDVARIVPTRLLPGNHDLDIKEYFRDLFPISIGGPRHYYCDRVLYIHGHQFDPVYQSTWAWISRLPLAKRIMPCIAKRLYGSPYVLKSAARDESYSRLVGLIEARALLHVKGRFNVVFGHTHSEFVRRSGNGWAANCGDFTDSCSTLKVIDGEPELVWYK